MPNQTKDDRYRTPPRPVRPPQPPPSWWTKIKDRLNQLGTPSGLGGGSITPAFPLTPPAGPGPSSFLGGGGTMAQGAGGQAVQISKPPQYTQPATYGISPRPAQRAPAYGGGYNPTIQQRPPAWLGSTRPAEGPSSFFGGGGDVVQGPNGPVPSTIPTGSFIGGGGDYVLGPNRQAYYIGPQGPNTFIGAGGEAVRGPDMPISI